MKRFSPPSVLIVCALRGTLFLGAGLTLVQPCRGGPGVFTNTGSLGVERQTHTATLLPNGKVLVVGGENNNGDLASAELYDPASGTWAATGSLGDGTPPSHSDVTTQRSGARRRRKWRQRNSRERGTVRSGSGTWMATGSLAIARNEATAILLPNGKVLVVGGYDSNNGGIYFASAELYDPVSGTWTTTGSLATARSLNTVTLLPSGKVLVDGRTRQGDVPLASAEVYDPASGTWAATGSLTAPRRAHSATLLPNGKVLVAGGS